HATPGTYLLPLHDALPISVNRMSRVSRPRTTTCWTSYNSAPDSARTAIRPAVIPGRSVPWTRQRIVELYVTRSVWLLPASAGKRSEEHTSELQSRENLVCR